MFFYLIRNFILCNSSKNIKMTNQFFIYIESGFFLKKLQRLIININNCLFISKKIYKTFNFLIKVLVNRSFFC